VKDAPQKDDESGRDSAVILNRIYAVGLAIIFAVGALMAWAKS
jgi:hypothetical protein